MTGRAHLADNRDVADRILAAMEDFGAKMAKARAWFYRHEEGGDPGHSRRHRRRSTRRGAR